MSALDFLPVAVIGAGPVGLAAVAHLLARDVPVKVYEAGESVGENVRDWGHVRLFSPWHYNIDDTAAAILKRHGWQPPCGDVLPTGAELYAQYLKPLAEMPEVAATLELGTRVTAISRLGVDKMTSRERETRPFALSVRRANGRIGCDLARAVIDASGTWTNPNPLGARGVPAEGEIELADRMTYGVPDVLGRDRAVYAGRNVAVVGAGHSAATVILDLATLAEDEPKTQITWVTRSTNLARVFGRGRADRLPARGEIGERLKALIDRSEVTIVPGFAATALRTVDDGLMLLGDTADGKRTLGPVHRVVVATGQRPDLNLTRELRLELDPATESTKALGPLIDPNVHSCGSVPPHGYRELAHPEPGFYTVGIKSYGRAPTFLMRTGYEQVRSVVAALAGDRVAADNLDLVLSETGGCSSAQGRAATVDREKEALAGCAQASGAGGKDRHAGGTTPGTGTGNGCEQPQPAAEQVEMPA